MRDTLTISLPKKLRLELRDAARREGVTQSEFARKALKVELFRRAMRETRDTLVPKARAMGIYTDEDVFRTVS